jgi:hypothetical protein
MSSPGGTGVNKPSAFISRHLLLVMFSIAARFRSHKTTSLSPVDGSMWPAGDEYYNTARAILGRMYVAPRASTCQALLLMGYREVGIGAMAQAWLYIGMAIRMAQDLGLHKNADHWFHDGTQLFNNVELQERRRIWNACVVMDKYVSCYIGRPVAIHECDFDTELPSETEVRCTTRRPCVVFSNSSSFFFFSATFQPEELEDWRSKPSTVIVYDPDDHEGAPLPVITIPGRVISCFNASTKLGKPHVPRPCCTAHITRRLSQLPSPGVLYTRSTPSARTPADRQRWAASKRRSKSGTSTCLNTSASTLLRLRRARARRCRHPTSLLCMRDTGVS